jgi:CheY-like chemotaxis protein
MTIHILFVDDEPEFIRAHINALQDSGYKVKSVRSHTEALEALTRQRFDLIVLDLILPRSETELLDETDEPGAQVGLDLHRIIREDLGLTQVPIVFFTVMAEPAIRHHIQKIEARFGLSSTILVKPTLPSKLLNQIRHLTGGRDG